MNRELIFRAWNKLNGGMIYNIQNKNIFETNLITHFDYFIDKIFKIMQFTGLLDKNGKKIFEGDIDKSELVIHWNQLHCCFGLFSKNEYKKDIIADICDEKGNTLKKWKCSDIEIIGNIFENPELLK